MLKTKVESVGVEDVVVETPVVEAVEAVEPHDDIVESVEVVEKPLQKSKESADYDKIVTITIDDIKKDEYKSIGVRSPGLWHIRKVGNRVYTDHQSC